MSMDIRFTGTPTFPNLNCLHNSIYIKTYNTWKWELTKPTNLISTYYGLALTKLWLIRTVFLSFNNFHYLQNLISLVQSQNTAHNQYTKIKITTSVCPRRLLMCPMISRSVETLITEAGRLFPCGLTLKAKVQPKRTSRSCGKHLGSSSPS